MNIQHIEVFAGEDRTVPLAARDSNNLPVDLTSKTVTWYVGRSPWRPDFGNAIFSKTGTAIAPTAGTFSVPIAAADTLHMSGDYEHMAKTTDAAGLVAVVCQGRFRVRSALHT